MPRAAEVLVETLVAHGVDRIFCIPGESYLPVIDALFDRPEIDPVTTRHEGGASFMAVADAKMTGRAGVAFVSRGPGAANATIGVHVAGQDAVPLVLFVGQVARADRGRGAFQEVDYVKTFSDMAKWVVEIDDADMMAESVRRAFHIAAEGTPGPVIVSLPEDMLDEETANDVLSPAKIRRPAPAPGVISEIGDRIAVAERPLIIAGGQITDDEAKRALRNFSETWKVPVAVAWRHHDIFDHTHPHFACHLAFNMPPIFRETLNEADLIIGIGTRLGDVVTQGYQLPTAPRPRQPLIHIYPDPFHLGRVFETDIPLPADADAALVALNELNAPPVPHGRDDWISRAHNLSADRMKWEMTEAADGVPFGNLVSHLARTVADDAIVTVDAGNFSTWVHRLFPFKTSHTFLAPVAGSMGMGVPATIAGALRHPGRQAIGFVGDGGFQMTGNELAVAVERNLPIRLFVSNNGSYGTIRLYQERNYPGRIHTTDLVNPDFQALARAYGAEGFRIAENADIEPVVRDAFATDGPAVIEVMTSLEYLAAYVTLGGLRTAAAS